MLPLGRARSRISASKLSEHTRRLNWSNAIEWPADLVAMLEQLAVNVLRRHLPGRSVQQSRTPIRVMLPFRPLAESFAISCGLRHGSPSRSRGAAHPQRDERLALRRMAADRLSVSSSNVFTCLPAPQPSTRFQTGVLVVIASSTPAAHFYKAITGQPDRKVTPTTQQACRTGLGLLGTPSSPTRFIRTFDYTASEPQCRGSVSQNIPVVRERRPEQVEGTISRRDDALAKPRAGSSADCPGLKKKSASVCRAGFAAPALSASLAALSSRRSFRDPARLRRRLRIGRSALNSSGGPVGMTQSTSTRSP